MKFYKTCAHIHNRQRIAAIESDYFRVKRLRVVVEHLHIKSSTMSLLNEVIDIYFRKGSVFTKFCNCDLRIRLNISFLVLTMQTICDYATKCGFDVGNPTEAFAFIFQHIYNVNHMLCERMLMYIVILHGKNNNIKTAK